MKPEVYYERLVISTSIAVALSNIDWQMRNTKLSDPYFKQLSVEKYALDELQERLREADDGEAVSTLEEFVTEMNGAACINDNQDDNFVFSVSRDAAQSLLDNLYFDRDYHYSMSKED